jgi:hypothetical protein
VLDDSDELVCEPCRRGGLISHESGGLPQGLPGPELTLMGSKNDVKRVTTTLNQNQHKTLKSKAKRKKSTCFEAGQKRAGGQEVAGSSPVAPTFVP